MTFSNEQLQELSDGQRSVGDKHARLMEGYLSRRYENVRAKEYARHGFLRRIKILTRCIENVFSILPPNLTELPTTNELSDAAINLQAFVFNVFGSIDNLAWIWVLERQIVETNGSQLRANYVGLRENNTIVRGSFSEQFRAYLAGLDSWFEYQENFRHAIAHRVPLYIPPYIVHPDNLVAYQTFTNQMTDAFNNREFAEYNRLSNEQDMLGSFSPRMLHSFEETRQPIYFHFQLLADFNTVDEIGLKMIEELDR
jgi:hypothetical protein